MNIISMIEEDIFHTIQVHLQWEKFEDIIKRLNEEKDLIIYIGTDKNRALLHCKHKGRYVKVHCERILKNE